MIHTFGDSHARGDTGKRCSIAGWQYCDNVAAHWLGAILCYSFGKENLDRCNISDEKYNVKDGDSVVFSFGEIDCRCHINKQLSLWSISIYNI